MINTEDNAGNTFNTEEIKSNNNISLANTDNVLRQKIPEIQFKINNTGSITKRTKTNYHEQRLSQSKWAFRLSFWGSIIGFGVIIWSVVYGIRTGDAQWPGIVSGVIMEAVSALFYTLSNIANEKISEFFIELTKDGNIETAVKIADEINNPNIKDELKVKLSLYLAGISEDNICKNTKTVCKRNDIKDEI